MELKLGADLNEIVHITDPTFNFQKKVIFELMDSSFVVSNDR